ncbi:MAG: RrF2 family transcriptional regulator [Solirubrobacteraceae bacterium]|nr:MAG: Rrf2 family transcriptional regulator [Solirubrobacterales bacterium]
MIFSAKTEYGVRLMVELGRHGDGPQPVSLKTLAAAEQLPLSYLEHVVAALKRAELVTASRGAHGGYRLARSAAEITMDEVVHALEGTIAPMECFADGEHHRVFCSHEGQLGQHCATRLLWTRVQSGVVRALQTTTLADLVAFAGHGPDAVAGSTHATGLTPAPALGQAPPLARAL